MVNPENNRLLADERSALEAETALAREEQKLWQRLETTLSDALDKRTQALVARIGALEQSPDANAADLQKAKAVALAGSAPDPVVVQGERAAALTARKGALQARELAVKALQGALGALEGLKQARQKELDQAEQLVAQAEASAKKTAEQKKKAADDAAKEAAKKAEEERKAAAKKAAAEDTSKTVPEMAPISASTMKTEQFKVELKTEPGFKIDADPVKTEPGIKLEKIEQPQTKTEPGLKAAPAPAPAKAGKGGKGEVTQEELDEAQMRMSEDVIQRKGRPDKDLFRDYLGGRIPAGHLRMIDGRTVAEWAGLPKGASWPGTTTKAAAGQPTPAGGVKKLSKRRRVKLAPPPKKMEVDVAVFGENNFYTGFDLSIATGGLFVSSLETLPPGHEVDLEIHLEDRRIATRGRVEWIRADNLANPEFTQGAGLKLLNLSRDNAAAIEGFFQKRQPLFFAAP